MSLADAIVDMVEAAVPAVTVYDGRVPDGSVSGEPPQRYVVVYIPGPRLEADTVAHESTSGTLRWQVTSVAPDRQMTAWLADTVRDALVDHRPAADGWEPGLIRHTDSHIPRPDEDVQERPVVFAVDRYAVDAERLPAAES